MIICQACTHENKLGTIYCRQCGTKLIIDMAAVEQSILRTQKSHRDDGILHSGRSAMALCSFALVCSLIFAYLVVPPMPPTVLPQPQHMPIFSPETTTANTSEKPLIKTTIVPQKAPTAPLLLWRQQQAPRIINELQLDLPKLKDWLKTLIASVDENGRVAGSNDLAATALTTLALQAYPIGKETVAAIAQCQAFILAHSDNLVRKDPYTISLVACALADWDGIPPALFASIEIAIIDGKAAPWQTWLIPLLNPKDRPNQLAALRQSATDQVWLSFLKLIDPKNTPALPFGDIQTNALSLGESRMAWSFCAWSHPEDHNLIRSTINEWLAQDPAPVEENLQSVAGKQAATAVALIATSTLWRLPASWQPAYHP